jgi:hypothetical protein
MPLSLWRNEIMLLITNSICFQDPVCGSAHCGLAPYWSKKLGKSDLKAYQVVLYFMFLCQMWVSDRWYRRVPVLGTCQCQTPTLMITLNIYNFLKLLSVLTCQCLCCVWCPCLCPCFIVELEHHMNEGTYKPNALRFEVKMLCLDHLYGWFLSNVMIDPRVI